MKNHAIIAGIAFLILATGVLGYFLTPREGGETLILSPSVRAAQAWRYEVRKAIAELERIGREIERGLDDKETLLSRSQALEKALKNCFELEKELKITRAPLAYQKERDRLLEAVEAFAEAARLGVIYLNEPAEANKANAYESLRQARELLEEISD